jgi:class 3 adenylate cyclase/predicted ATPase
MTLGGISMHRLKSYLPQDRLRALIDGTSLPSRTHGSAIFADISGFTLLTEKLTQMLGPRKGVDTLSRQLNAVYGALIEQVEWYGGSIISFAGDSIISWFEEAGSSSAALRAVTCADGMQSAMASFKDLSLKIAITTGSARRFLVGSPEIQLMDTLAGKTIVRLATAERMAHKGEIIIDMATCEALGSQAATGEQRRDAVTTEQFAVFDSLIEPAKKRPLPELDEADLPKEKLRPWLLPTVYEREQSNLSAFLTELRPAVPLFLNFSGIDYDNDAQAEEKLNKFVAHVQQVAAKYEGAVLQLVIGDKGSYIYAVFGAPIAHEDDAKRAVYAALELRKVPEQLAFIQSIRMGISLGTLRVGAYGSETRRTYAVLGDEVNVAARLMANAAIDEILITGRVQIEAAETFALEPREPLSMKGVAEPQPVYSVTGISSRRATRLPEPEYRLPMVGRQEELALVDEKLSLAFQGKGQVIGITAEAGMGKSRLVAEIIRLARKRGFVGYGGACLSSGVNTPYLVWRPIWQAFFDLDLEMPLRKQIRWLEGEIEERAPERLDALPLLELVLGIPLPDNEFTKALEPQDRKGTLEALLEECLKSAVQETPLLIVLEDLHWIDPLSHDLFESLALISKNLPICFVAAYRPPDPARLYAPPLETLPYFTKIKLTDLAAPDAEQLIRAKLAQLFPERTGSLPKILTRELMTKSQGNPFFIEELLNYLHDRGLDPYNAESFKALELPASLHMLVLSRIDQLTEPQKVTLRVASVIGRIFPFSWLHGYYPGLGAEDVVKENLAELSKVDLTPLDTPEPELAYIFKHIVTQEVTYESLSYNTRAQLHELLAKYLEAVHPDDTPLNLLAFHYSRTENLPKKREYLRKSGEAAQAAFSNEAALEYYEQALETSPDQEDRIELHLKTGMILQMIGKWDEAKSHYEAALQVAEERHLLKRIVECQVKLATWLDLRGNYEPAREKLEHIYELAKQIDDQAGICDVLSELGSVHWRLGKFDAALQYAKQGLELARQIRDKKREGDSLFFMATISGQQGNYAESHKYFEETLSITKSLNDKRKTASAVMNDGTNYYYEGDYTAARKLFEEGLASYREIGDKRGTTIALNNLGNIFYLEDDYQTARKYYQEALTLARESGDRYTMSLALSSLGITAFQQGKFAEANGYYQESLVVNKQLGDKVGLSLLYCYLGLLALAQSQTSTARASFQEGLRISHQSEIKLYLGYNLIGMACVFVAEGLPAQAAKILGAATVYAQEIGFKLETELQRPYDNALVSAKESLDEAAFQTAWEEGQTMKMEQVVQFALENK